MPADPEFAELVTVVETSNPTLLVLMKSVLDGAEIPYYAKGEALKNLFGLGQVGSGSIRSSVRSGFKSESTTRRKRDTCSTIF